MIPSQLPQWASEDVQDEQTGQYNVVEPPLEVKQEGWSALEVPNRQWWNWFNRTVYDWIVYYNTIIGPSSISQAFAPVWTGLTNPPDVNECYYSLIGDRCFISGNINYSGNVNVADTLSVPILPYPPKDVTALRQIIQVERGTIATIPNGKTLFGSIRNDGTGLIITETDLSTGISTDVLVKGASGRLRYSGSYLIEPSP